MLAPRDNRKWRWGNWSLADSTASRVAKDPLVVLECLDAEETERQISGPRR